MGFKVEFEDEAVKDLERHTPLLQSQMLDEIEAFAADPVGLSKPGAFPYPLYQRYPFSIESEEKKYHFTLLFQYGADEETIWIKFIGYC